MRKEIRSRVKLLPPKPFVATIRPKALKLRRANPCFPYLKSISRKPFDYSINCQRLNWRRHDILARDQRAQVRPVCSGHTSKPRGRHKQHSPQWHQLGADYVVWRKSPGGIYTQDDFNTWRTHLGQPPGSGSGVSSNVTVLDPANFLLLLFGNHDAGPHRKSRNSSTRETGHQTTVFRNAWEFTIQSSTLILPRRQERNPSRNVSVWSMPVPRVKSYRES